MGIGPSGQDRCQRGSRWTRPNGLPSKKPRHNPADPKTCWGTGTRQIPGVNPWTYRARGSTTARCKGQQAPHLPSRRAGSLQRRAIVSGRLVPGQRSKDRGRRTVGPEASEQESVRAKGRSSGRSAGRLSDDKCPKTLFPLTLKS